MAFEEEHECEESDGAAWMATFADLMSLLLTFFVLLLSFANMDVVRFRVALGSVREAMGVQFEHPGNKEAVSTTIVELSKEESTSSLKIIDEVMMLKKIRKFIKESKMEHLMEASLTERGVVIRIKGHLLFGSGEASLRTEAPEALEPLLKLIKVMPHQLSVEGHTDDRPIRNGSYPSNWELSTARAVSTMRYLVANGLDQKRVNVAGYAHMRPIGDNSNAKERSRNRRVEFIFLRPPDAKPITTEEIEAAKVEMERMRARGNIDIGPTSGDDATSKPSPESVSDDAPTSTTSTTPMNATPPTAALSDDSAKPTESKPPRDDNNVENPSGKIAPSLSPGIRADDVVAVPPTNAASVPPNPQL